MDCRKGMGLYVTVGPVKVLEPLRGISPLKPERLGDLDIEIVRELAGGMYFGERGSVTEKGEERAWDTESYSTREIERVATFAFSRAESRSRRLCSVDKANVLSSSQLWRRTVAAMSTVYRYVKLEHMYVDNAAMQLTLRPAQFDVILSSNMFGDILSDAAAALVGSIGLVPSASFGSTAPLFEPINGSAAHARRRLSPPRHRRAWPARNRRFRLHGITARRNAALPGTRRTLRLGRL